MTVMRGVFLAAFLMLTAGSIGIRSAVTPLFHSAVGPREPTIAPPVATLAARTTVSRPKKPVAPAAPTATRPPAPVATHRTEPTAPVPTATRVRITPTITILYGTVTTTPTPPQVKHRVRPHPTPAPTRARPTAIPRPTSTAIPTATPTAISGTVALTSYWVGEPSAQPGQTISVGYVIDNGTGHTVHVMLGASLKSARVLNWATGSLADTYHDVVATVPPGVTTHVRYFTLPAGVRAGSYDVAWGLRDAATGTRDALVFASAALRVSG